ncbi:hypothetical protein D1872_335910 [compost metagenome]
MQNVGGSPAQIYKIEVSGKEIDKVYTINPGEDTKIEVPLSSTSLNLASGVAYSVTIYTEAGNVYTATVYGK